MLLPLVYVAVGNATFDISCTKRCATVIVLMTPCRVCMFAQHLLLSLVCSAPIALIFIFIILDASVSGMPNNACPFLGTTKNLHFSYYFYALLLLCMYLTR